MTTKAKILLLLAGISEIPAMFLIARLWLRRTDRGIPWRTAWTLVLLVPFAGPLLYGAFDHGVPTEHGNPAPRSYYE